MRLDGRNVTVTRTCNLNSVLQLIYMSFKVYHDIETFIRHHCQVGTTNISALITVFKEMDSSKWNSVRSITIQQIICPTLEYDEDGKLNLYGSEERFLNRICNLIPISCFIDCPNRKCNISPDMTMYPMKDIIIQSPAQIN